MPCAKNAVAVSEIEIIGMEHKKQKKQKRLYLGLITTAALSVMLCISLEIVAGEYGSCIALSACSSGGNVAYSGVNVNINIYAISVSYGHK